MTRTAQGRAETTGWRRRRSLVVGSGRLTNAVVAVLFLGMFASCGGGGSGDKTKAAENPATSRSPDGSSGAPSSGSTDSAGTTGSGGSNYNRKLPAKVRVVNMYSRSGTGEKIDVWTGSAVSGKKLATIDYGVVSDSFTPLASEFSQPQKVNGKDVYSYMLTFYTEGGTTQKERINSQNESAFPGDELTVLIGPGSATPQSFAPAAGTESVLFTKTENTTTGSAPLFDKVDPPAGKALVLVSAVGVPIGVSGAGSTSTSSSGSGSAGLTFDVGQEGKGCLPEVGPQAPQPGDTHTRSLTSPQGGGGFYYVVPPGAQRLSLYGGTDTGCKGKSIGGPFEVNVSSGDHVGLLLYGSPEDLKFLVVPL